MPPSQNDIRASLVENNRRKYAALQRKFNHAYTVDESTKDEMEVTYMMIESYLDRLVPVMVKKNVRSGCGCFRLKVLQAGCADGILSEKINFEDHGAALYGFDPSVENVEIAHSRGKYERLNVASLTEELPYASDCFDFVVSNGALGHISNFDAIYKLLRVVKSDGYILINMKNYQFEDLGYENVLNRLTGKCRVVVQQPFSTHPHPKFNHKYRFILIQKY